MSGTTWPALVAGAKAKASEVESKFDWIEGDIVPMTGGTKTDATYDLGESSFRWRNLYLTTKLGIGVSSIAREIDVRISNSGGSVSELIFNTANAASSDAYINVVVGGTSAGDAYYTAQVNGTNPWIFGVDNSASDQFAIGYAAALGTLDYFIISTAGNIAIGPNATINGKFHMRTDAAEDNRLRILVNNATGDPFITWATSPEYSMGIDNSDSDKLKISASTALGTTDAFVMTTAGEITMPLQPAFLAYNSVADTSVANGATIEFDTEVFDQNSDFNNTTDTFTAPATGKYVFLINVDYSAVTLAVQVAIHLVTSNRTYVAQVDNASAGDDIPGHIGLSVIADMDAADTAYVSTVRDAGVITIDGGAVFTWFSGHLAC